MRIRPLSSSTFFLINLMLSVDLHRRFTLIIAIDLYCKQRLKKQNK